MTTPSSELSLIRVFEAVIRSEGKLDAIAARLDRVEAESAVIRFRVETLERGAAEAQGRATQAATIRATLISTLMASATGLSVPLAARRFRQLITRLRSLETSQAR